MKKNKLLLISTSTLLPMVSIIAPLATTSCSSATRFGAIGGEYDKEFGVSQATYKALKNSFWSIYKDRLIAEPRTSSKEYINREKTRLFNTFASYEENFNENKNISYTVLTESIINLASRYYGIKLVRNNTASISNVKQMFEGVCNSVSAYMIAADFPAQQQTYILENARNTFNNEILVSLQNEYNDSLSILLAAKSKLAECFADLNNDVALLAASNRLQTFLQDYQISYDYKRSGNKLDELEKNAQFKVGSDLSNFMTRIYTIKDSKGNVLDEFKSDKLLPGYTIKPILKNISRNEYKNQYTLDIDWQCVKTNYLSDPEKAEKTTAHFFDFTDTASNHELLKSIKSVQDLVTVRNVKTISYPIILSQEAESTTLKKVYLGDGSDVEYKSHLEFKWDDVEKCSYDPFFFGEKIQDKKNGIGTEQYRVKADALGATGLMIASVDASKQANDDSFVRLDSLYGSSMYFTDDDTRQTNTLDPKEDLIKNMQENCDLYSITTINSELEKTHSASSRLNLKYKNTCYEDLSSREIDNIQTSNFQISKNSYSYLVSEYNRCNDFISTYTNNTFEDDVDAMNGAIALESSMLALNVALNGLCVVSSITNPVKAPYFVAICVTAAASCGLQSASLGLMVDHKLHPTIRIANICKQVSESKACKNAINALSSAAHSLSLPTWNEDHEISENAFKTGYNLFSQKSWTDVKVALDSFQNAWKDGFMTQFVNLTKSLGISPEEYREQIGKDWGENGKYTKMTRAFDISAASLDMVNMLLSIFAPECEPNILEHITTVKKMLGLKESSLSLGWKAMWNTSFRKGVVSFAKGLPKAELKVLEEVAGAASIGVGSAASVVGRNQGQIALYEKVLGLKMPEGFSAATSKDVLSELGEDFVWKAIYAKYDGPSGKMWENFLTDLAKIDEKTLQCAHPGGAEIFDQFISEGSEMKQLWQNILDEARTPKYNPIWQNNSYLSHFELEAFSQRAMEAATPQELGRTIDEYFNISLGRAIKEKQMTLKDLEWTWENSKNFNPWSCSTWSMLANRLARDAMNKGCQITLESMWAFRVVR